MSTTSINGSVLRICLSGVRGKKTPVESGTLLAGHGFDGDVHAGDWHRQVSLLAKEQIDTVRAAGVDVHDGDFGENIVTEGIELASLPVGTRMTIGGDAVVEVTQIGKECPAPCAIYRAMGSCIMPTDGIFVRVIEGGTLARGDRIEVLP